MYPDFSCWHDHSQSIAGEPVSPIELSFLGSLWYLGHGLEFDNVPEIIGASKKAQNYFFLIFFNYGSNEFYNKFFIPVDR